ncbi:MAG: hypothetical protein FWD28_10105 [Treponema sp.]|nr:hypothetical protein [Treponema sp.]
MQKSNIAFVLIFLIFFSCATNSNKTNDLIDRTNPYSGMEILTFPNSQAYLFPNEKSDKLVIVLESSGWDSVLGIWQNDLWQSVGLAAFLLKELRNTHNILVPEKLKRQPGINYLNDMEDRANLTAHNLIACYTESINGYLEGKNFSSVVIFSGWEAAALLPLIYEKIDNKDKITALISFGFGGWSYYESLVFMSNIENIPLFLYEMISKIINDFNPENSESPDSYEDIYFDVTERWLNSFIHIRPFDYYKNINLPVLFLHGVHNYLTPSNSTIYIQNNLPDKPFTFRYFMNWAFQPIEHDDVDEFVKLIANWILLQ